MTSLILIAGLIVGSYYPRATKTRINTIAESQNTTKDQTKRRDGTQQHEDSKNIHAGNTLGSARLIHYVKPRYPEQLRRKHVEGVVQIKVVIGKDGAPKELVLLKGPKELVPYATEAVRRWRYKPALINGSPVEFITEARVPFTLSQ